MMPTQKKDEIINNLTEKFQNSSGIYFTKYSGMDVAQATAIRRKFRENDVSYVVSKNTLSKIAANQAGFEGALDNFLSGQVAIAYAEKDPTSPARVIKDFEKDNGSMDLEVLGMVVEGEIYSSEKYKELADLPSREELLSSLVGTLNQPMSSLVGVLNGSMSNFVRLLAGLRDSKD
jgi:large subunit ribosomal protein L10